MRFGDDGPRSSAARAGRAARTFLHALRGSTVAVFGSVLLLDVSMVACGGGGGLFRQYEYEEEMYLSLDGSATIYVNSSIAALNALRGTSFDASPSGRFDRDEIREYFSSPLSRVTRVSQSRRSGRRFVHVRVEVNDIRRLTEVKPFAWSTYAFDRNGDEMVYRQTLGAPPNPDAAAQKAAGWRGQELVVFRMHLPSRIDYHNTPTHEVGRGNILTWEQPLADRLRGAPLTLEARIQTQSILYRTLWLFAVTFVVVAVVFVAVIWWIVRRGKPAHDVISQTS